MFSRKQGGKRAEHENDDIDAILQEILDDDYQPISTHDVVNKAILLFFQVTLDSINIASCC